MEIKKIINGYMENNTYLLIKGDDCLLIDPSFEKEKIEKELKDKNLKAILITHGHFDHIFSVEYFAKKYHVPVYLNTHDDFLLNDPYGGVNNEFNKDDVVTKFDYVDLAKINEIKDFNITVIHTPGHTPGSTCFYNKEKNVVFTGDTLFYKTIGATRFPRSNEEELRSSIKEKLLSLPNQTVVLPGHGQDSTIENEKLNNPFLK